MTDEELIRAVAEKVMGAFENYTYITEDIWEIKVKTVKCWVMEDGTELIGWNPINKPRHWMVVVERMIELGFTLKLGYGKTIQGVLAWVRFTSEPYSTYCHNKQIGRAVCEAALKAVGGEI